MEMILEVRKQGVTQEKLCGWVGLSPRRVQRWRSHLQHRQTLHDRHPGPDLAPHRLLVEEKKTFIAFACSEANQDASARAVAYRAQDQEVLAISPSSAYRTLEAEGLMGQRGHARRSGRSTAAPVREELTGPNQRWCWDITYLRTIVKYQFLFLHVMLDEWSRKVVGWLIAGAESAVTGKLLMDRALGAEGLLDETRDLPIVINDRGAPMKAKVYRQFLQDLGVSQLFSRPRTPNDNPFVESFFRTTKYHPAYPDRFAGSQEAHSYFVWFFRWYNNEHLHSRIGNVPPALKHAGQADAILVQRRARLAEARSHRLEVNRRASENNVVEIPLKEGGL